MRVTELSQSKQPAPHANGETHEGCGSNLRKEKVVRENLDLVESAAESEAVEDRYLTRREVAARCRVPLSTFDSLRRQARVPFPDADMGKHMLWRLSTIETFLEAGGTRGLQ